MKRALLLLLLAACHGGTAAAGSADEIRIHLSGEPAHLNPLLSSDFVITQVALGDVYEPLFSVDAHGAIVPVLAERVDVSPDGRTWTFTLREGVTWHDGQPFGAPDVAYTLRLLGPGGAPATLSADFDDQREVSPVDARTVRVSYAGFRLGRRDSLALVPMLPAHLFARSKNVDLLENPASRAPVGTGPYAFESWKPGREIRLRRAATWRGPRPAAESIVYRIVADRAQALAQLDSGDLHLVLALPYAQLPEAARDPKIQVLAYPYPYYVGARWSCKAGKLADARVRRALTMLLDREGVVKTVQNGRGRVASAPWQPDDDAYDRGVAPWPFDPEAARALLAEAGASDLHVKLLVPAGSVTLGRLSTIWQADARKAGVTLEVVEDPDVMTRARTGDFEGFAFGWTTGAEQDLFHHFHSPPAGSDNYGACSDAQVDQLLEAIRAEPQHDARVALEHQLHRKLHELEWLTVISIDERTAAASKRLQGIHPGPHGTPARDLSLAP